MKRILCLGIGSCAVLFLSHSPPTVSAATLVNLNQATVGRGITISDPAAGFRLGIPPGVLAEPALVTVAAVADPLPEPPDGYSFGLAAVSYDISQSFPAALERPLRLSWSVPQSLQRRYIAYYDRGKAAWERVRTADHGDRVTAELRFPSVWIAVLEKAASFNVPGTTSSSMLVYHPGTRAVLGERNARRPRPIASLTKLMTALVVLETNPDWDKTLTYQRSDERPGARLALRVGDTLTVRDAFTVMLIGSANNAAALLARSTGLGPKSFQRRMNDLAARLGMADSAFVDPTGLDPRNVATAYDVALLSAAAFADPEIAETVATPEYLFATANTKRRHRIRTTNALLERRPDVTIGKTGYLEEAGYCLTVRSGAPTEEPGSEVIAVVLGNKRSAARFNDAEQLLNVAGAVVAGMRDAAIET